MYPSRLTIHSDSEHGDEWYYEDQLSDFHVSSDEFAMLDLINAHRKMMNPDLSELSILPEASLVARMHSHQRWPTLRIDCFGHDVF